MSSPISISPSQSPPRNGMTPSSSISISPQTPFFPPPGLNGLISPTSANTQGGGTGFLKWAASFSGSLSKSPTFSAPSAPAGPPIPPPVDAQTAPGATQTGFAIPATPNSNHDHDHDHDHDEHDSFEFGDFGRNWAPQGKTRRTVSMSGGPGSLSGMGLGGVINGGVANPNASTGVGLGVGTAQDGAASMPVGSLGNQGVLGEKAARGQGVLRRLSLSGSSFARPNFLSPTLPPAQNLPSPPQVPNTLPKPAESPTKVVEPAAPVPPASAVPTGARGRRFSENAGNKKRGVSPMGERILRDHGHF